MATKPTRGTSSVKCGDSASTAKARPSSTIMSCDRTSSTKSKSLKRNHVKPKSSKPTRSCGMLKPMNCTPFRITNGTNWCTTREWWIHTPSIPTPMDTRDFFPKSTPSHWYCLTLLNSIPEESRAGFLAGFCRLNTRHTLESYGAAGHQNGTLLLSKWNTHQNGTLIKMEHSY